MTSPKRRALTEPELRKLGIASDQVADRQKSTPRATTIALTALADYAWIFDPNAPGKPSPFPSNLSPEETTSNEQAIQ